MFIFCPLFVEFIIGITDLFLKQKKDSWKQEKYKGIR